MKKLFATSVFVLWSTLTFAKESYKCTLVLTNINTPTPILVTKALEFQNPDFSTCRWGLFGEFFVETKTSDERIDLALEGIMTDWDGARSCPNWGHMENAMLKFKVVRRDFRWPGVTYQNITPEIELKGKEKTHIEFEQYVLDVECG